MGNNPKVIEVRDGEYGVRFVRSSGKVLHWVQCHIGKTRSMKDTNFVSSPMVRFSSEEEAEQEIQEKVIPHLLTEKGVDQADILGWSSK